MPNLTIFSKEIRTLDGLYSLNDLHKASGANPIHRPNQFLRLAQTKELIDEILRCADLRITENQRPDLVFTTKRGGANKGTWVCKDMVYSYAMWISAKFHLQVIRAFDAMMNAPTALPSYTGLNLNEDQARFLRCMLRMSDKLEKRGYNTMQKIRSVKSQLSILQEQCAHLEAQAKELEGDMALDLDVLKHLHLYKGLMVNDKNGQELRAYLDS